MPAPSPPPSPRFAGRGGKNFFVRASCACPRRSEGAGDGGGGEVAAGERVRQALHVGDQAAAERVQGGARVALDGADGVDVEQAEGGQRLERDPLLRAAARQRRIARQRRHVLGQRREL